ncbi:MSHA biogenesis protein MshI2 [Shewanella sairae]|uniref:MSHA biogenesis protein MshI2 n=1 Tax=Shewanella sairae TaxID=190310 RepID=A0ABQ4P0N1_9GAMM|nr:PilN domain-containing protein [Shewanella sairae]MCL1129562.1 PilN domain-containing protein [Shewanella sairae]GIU41055.1 MSHA biogenesis protein MshI2 [Shewanella sairae]
MKLRVNLYSSDLLPVKLRLSFLRLCQAFVGLVIFLLILTAITMGLNNGLESDKKLLMIDKKHLNSEKQNLETALAQRGPTESLVAEVELKAQQLELKRKLFDKLSKEEELTSYSYSPLMTDLASVANSKVWLNRIRVDENRYIFEGFTSSPEGVPLWVERLKTTKTLKGHAFASMTMNLGENQPLAFKLTSEADADKEVTK